LARASLRSVSDGLPEPTAFELALLTSEVVSNALQHAPGDPAEEISLRVSRDGIVRVEVDDCGGPFDPPEPREPWDVSPNGWGLFLLDSVADAWGVDRNPTGKVVWFELDPDRDVE
jgi:anti-sigma regulatory factor (Ser/Thr protein kinase)